MANSKFNLNMSDVDDLLQTYSSTPSIRGAHTHDEQGQFAMYDGFGSSPYMQNEMSVSFQILS